MRPRTVTLTARQAEYLRAIWRYLEDHGRYPSSREVRSLVGCSSQAAAHRMLQVLIGRGYLLRVKHGWHDSYALAGVELRPEIAPGPEGARLAQALGMEVER